MKKIDKHYVSDIDKALAEFDSSHPKSASQMAETKKYKWVHERRDNPNVAPEETQDKLWEDF